MASAADRGSLLAFAAHGAGAVLVGLDRTGLGCARPMIVSLGTARPGDLTRPLPLAASSVDAVVCHNVIELLADPTALLGEVARVARQGGRR